MPLSWNEIKSRALTFSRTWSDAAVDKAYATCGGKKTYRNDAERVAFLFDLYQRQTSLLPVGKAAGKAKPSGPVQSRKAASA